MTAYGAGRSRLPLTAMSNSGADGGSGQPGPESSWDDELAELLVTTSPIPPAEPTADNIARGGGFWVPLDLPPPLTALVPLSELQGPVVGRRVRRVIDVDRTAWMSDLRVWSEPIDGKTHLVREADWCRVKVAQIDPECAPSLIYAVRVAAVYVEQYVTSTAAPPDDDGPLAWLHRVQPRGADLAPIVPIRARHAGYLTGRRAIITTPTTTETGRRIVTEPVDCGELGITVGHIDEAAWHVMGSLTPGVAWWQSIQETAIDQVWIEG